jgi:hypothetical protein
MAAITVKQLRERLALCPDEAIVVLSKDAEGNGFSPLPDGDGLSVGRYVADSTWSGEFRGDDPDEVVAVCLWPTN